ncbi:integrase [Rhodoplanes roseus]|uniref:Integrase n=1 Tax=Rhodoplanes roseus TaxID=29409 RepID=A0A327KYH9_9BRAD|nr:integrase [Rhodoplanes roseus]RAI42813.1 hypothetical protein CH341_17630 [Rhodoplanes roseus]
MPRARQPIAVDGVTIALDAPGLKLLRRPGGRLEPRWVASDDARRRGYRPRTVRLHGDIGAVSGLQEIAARCRVLWAEMEAWLAEDGAPRRALYDGTLASLIALYQTDADSPYRAVRPNTRRGYDDWCRTLARKFGARRIDRLHGTDLRRWYLAIAAPPAPGGTPRLRLASACVRSMLMILLSYGVELHLPGCLALAQALERMTLRVPQALLDAWHAAKPARTAMTYEHAAAIVAAGLARGTRRHRSISLGVALQFELTLAQIDVIGTWEPLDRAVPVPAGAVTAGRSLWRPGLCWEDFSPGMVLDIARHKTGVAAAFDLSAYPLVMAAIAAVPDTERHGPVAIDDAGRPFRRRHYVTLYGELAAAAGVPASVWNMSARHGGATEAREAGCAIEDVADHLQKTDLEGTRRDYVAGNLATTRRVAAARVAKRKTGVERHGQAK